MITAFFILGFWICVAVFVFNVGVYLVMLTLAGIVSAIGWVVDKVRGV